MSFSLYDLDEDIRKLLNLDNFLGGHTVNDFIEELSKDHFLKGAEVNKLEYLDPKPYIRTFESTLRELKRLNEDGETRKRHVEREVEEYELKHSENVIALSSKVDRITESFTNLDSKISSVTTKIDPLGRSLNKITNSRDRSTETIFLIRAYHGFYTKERYEPLEKLKSSNIYEDRVKCAKTIVDLLTLAKKIASPELAKANHCVNVIEKFSETFEKELLIKFDVYFEDDQFDKMREIASILHQFNGGATVVQLFVNKHDFMLDSDNTEDSTMLDNEAIWTKLSDPSFGENAKDESTEQLLNRLRMAIKAQARIVQQVFEDPTPVLKIFIQRIYAQIIQNKISALLQYSLSVGTLAHVRILHSLYVLVGDFTREVKEFLQTNDLNQDDELGSILDQCNYDLFIEYTSETTYFSREKKNLEETIYDIVQKYTSFHETQLAAKSLTTKLENLDNIEYNSEKLKRDQNSGRPLLEGVQDRFSFHFLERKRLSQFTNFMKTKLSEKTPPRSSQDLFNDREYVEKYSKLNIGIVEVVVKSAIESIARVLELTPNKAPDFLLEILEILLFDFGKLYIGASLEVAFEGAKQENLHSRSGTVQTFSLSYLQSFGVTSEVLYLISSCIKKIILPCAVNSPNVRKRMYNLTNSYVSRCETSLNLITTESLEMVANRIAFLLLKQRKKDFVMDTITEEDTEACEEVALFLNEIYEKIVNHLNNANLRNYLIKIGMNFLNQLLEHYKKFPVNSTGGIILTKDVIRYQSIIDEWKISELSEQFQLLKEIANLFTVHPDLINSLVTEGQLANLKPYTIRQYVSKRTDFNPSYIERFFSLK